MNKNTSLIIKHAVLGVLGALAAMLAFCCLTAALVQAETIPEQMGRLAAIVLTELALLLMCLFVAKSVPQRRLPVSVAVALAFVAMRLLLKTVLFHDEALRIGWEIVVPFLLAILAGLIAGMKKQRRR